MNLNPATMVDPVFHFLDWIISESGVCLFLAFAWLSLILIAWIFSGGLHRKFPNQPHVNASIGIIIRPHTPPPPPTIIIQEFHPPDDGMD
jgi:hypothetical protein